MDYTIKSEYHGFQLTDKWHITEVDSEAHLFEHIKTGAKLLYLKNDDNNKVFCVSFRTPPVDNCGTTHILEHSVLCGSDKYPLKEPFVELIKSSMNTFLNAMTFPDKTMYPIASKNHADFKNLMDVYCDAVFNPLIKNNEYTFYQEGWHYHIEKKNDPVTINGVVYNEMKGAFSDPEEVMMRYVQLSLYPDTSYAFESGGDPDAIPELTYQKFMDYYNTYYHPSNSYIYFYGDMDMLPYLAWMDENYLNRYEKKDIHSLPKRQMPFEKAREYEIVYSVDEDDETEGKCYFTANYKIGEANDSLLSYSFNVLMNILFDSDASPLKEALINADIADEISCDYVTGVREPYFTILAKNAKCDKYELFLTTIDETLNNLMRNGIDDDIIKSSLNSYEFELREADSGTYPRGLIFAMDIMESWLYDGKPGIHLQFEPYLKYLRENENSRFYADLIKRYLLENRHKSTILLLPQKGLEAKKVKEIKKNLKKYKESLTEKQLSDLIGLNKDLIEKQCTLDTEEAKNTIPVLAVSEIDAILPQPDFAVENYKNSNIYTHCDKARGIVYADINFDLNISKATDISCCELLSKILGIYETENYSQLALLNEIGIYLGDVDVNIVTHQNVDDVNIFEKRFVFFAKALAENLPKLYELTEEILLRTKINDPQKLYKTVCEEMSKFESKLVNASHTVVANRLNALITPRGEFNEYWGGVHYYKYLAEVKRQLENKDTSVLDELNRVYRELINAYRCDILLTCDADKRAFAIEQSKKFIDTLPNIPFTSAVIDLKGEGSRNEGIIIPSKVMYVGMGTNFKLLNYEYKPQMLVIKKYLTSVYLWDNIRILGGAYGAMMNIDKTGALAFVSYRDPKLRETLDVYKNIAKDIREANLTKQDINKLIIGTISDIDAPSPIYSVGRKMLYDMYKNDKWSSQQINRETILSTTSADIKNLSGIIGDVIKNSNICVAGAEDQLQNNKELFDRIYSITRKE